MQYRALLTKSGRFSFTQKEILCEKVDIAIEKR